MCYSIHVSKLIRLLFLLSISLSASFYSVSGSADEINTKVEDPFYGVALWHYFQGENFDALTELMLAEERGGIKGYGDEPRLMVAGLSLAYGMVDESRTIFQELINKDTPKALKQTAWYYLAKLEYEQGKYQLSAEAIENYRTSLNDSASTGWFGPKDPEIEYLHSSVSSLDFNVLLQSAENDPLLLGNAANLLNQAEFENIDPILPFNLGNAYSRQGKYDLAIQYFERARDELENQRLIQDDDLQLLDRIYTAEGFSQMLLGDSRTAMQRFGEVQQESMSFPLALLGYGRAASNIGGYQYALGYLEVLSVMPDYIKGVVESRISIAEAYEKLKQPEHALTRYRSAIGLYEEDMAEIDSQIAFLQTQSLEFLSLSDNLTNWLKSDDFIATPEPEFVRVFSENGFQTELKELQDLISLNKVVTDRIDRLALLEDILNERQSKRQRQIEEYQSMFVEEYLELYQGQLVDRNVEYQRVLDEGDYLSFISNDDEDLLSRVNQSLELIDSRENIADFIDDPAMDEKEDRLKFYKGLLLWQSAQDFSQNAWERSAELYAAEKELEQLKELKASVEVILNASTDFYPYFQRVDSMEATANLLKASLNRELDETKTRTFSQLISHLEARKENLRLHLTQARLALLRINEELGIAANQGGSR